MEEYADTTVNRGAGAFGLITLVLIILKLTGVITWSWWWVTILLWGPVVGVICIVAVWTAWKMAVGGRDT